MSDQIVSLADSGGATGTCPPNRSHFFHFDIHVFAEKHPRQGWRAHPIGNPGYVIEYPFCFTPLTNAMIYRQKYATR